MPAGIPTISPYLNTTVGGAQNYAFASLHELAWAPGASVNVPEFVPKVYQKYYKLYGDGFRLTTFLYAAGLIVNDWNSSRYTVFEEPDVEKTVELDAQIVAGAEGAPIAFTITAADRAYRLLGMSIYIPGRFCNAGVSNTPREYQVTAYNPATGIGAASPFNALTQITANVTAGTTLTVGPAKFGRGGGQPGGTRRTNLQRDFYVTIVGEHQEFEGGVNTFDPMIGTIDSEGSKTLYAKGLWQGEFLLERAKDKAILVSELNTNSLTTARRDGSPANVESFVGFRNHLDARAQQLPWQNTFEPQDMKKVKEIYETQGVMADMSFFGMGPRLYDVIQDGGFDFIKEYSGGQVLLDNMGKLGETVKMIDLYGHKVVLSQLATFADKQSFGNDSYRFSHEGFILPMQNVSVSQDGKKISIPNLFMGYRKGNMENRERMFGTIAGVNGMGMPFVDQFDSYSIEWKCEFGLGLLGANQMINVINI